MVTAALYEHVFLYHPHCWTIKKTRIKIHACSSSELFFLFSHPPTTMYCNAVQNRTCFQGRADAKHHKEEEQEGED